MNLEGGEEERFLACCELEAAAAAILPHCREIGLRGELLLPGRASRGLGLFLFKEGDSLWLPSSSSCWFPFIVQNRKAGQPLAL